ncbi:MAG: lipopolysaccharide biosynthesis protein RfbH [Lentisphaeria bacterium]|nr:lipopolysaccharide biosynthesis protein RfbH [Lentisphaeria bacterium]
MKEENGNPDAVKEEIFEKVKAYFSLVHGNGKEDHFVPGKSRVPYAGRVFDEKEMLLLTDSALEFWLTHGKYSRRFEKEFASFLGVKNAYLVNSGSSANLLAFSALTSPLLGERRIRRGDEVITVACSFPTTVAPVIQFGAVPVFVDVEKRTANIDCSRLENALSCRTKAVMIAHTLGNPFHVEKVKNFCDEHGLFLIEDNCDALGSTYDGKLTGTFGDIGTSSFYPPHHMTMGEGGAVYTDDPLLAKILLSLRDWGRECSCPSGVDNSCGHRFTGQFGSLPAGYDHKYVYSHFGYNLKATDMQAAIGCAQLEKLPFFIRKRQENFAFLHEKLKDLPGVAFLEKYEKSSPSWFGFLLIVEDTQRLDRNALARHLEGNGIQTRNLFAGNLVRHPCFTLLEEGKDYRIAGDLTQTDKLMRDALWIGVYPGMTEAKLRFMAEKIREYVL